MKNITHFNHPAILFVALLSSLPSMAADCSREDITFYLSKGFSTKQITTMCTPAPVTNASASVTVSPLKTIDSEQQARIIEQLSKTLEVSHLRTQDGQLLFRQVMDVTYGEEDEFGQLPEISPSFDVSIKLNSLRLIKANKHVPILRGASILVTGDVGIDIANLDKYNKKQKQGIQAFLDNVGKNTVKIMVENDADLTLVSTNISQLGELNR